MARPTWSTLLAIYAHNLDQVVGDRLNCHVTRADPREGVTKKKSAPAERGAFLGEERFCYVICARKLLLATRGPGCSG
jgi:hypothetical protein